MPPQNADSVRETLRALPVLEGDYPPFDAEAAPEHPAELFLDWLTAAIDADLREPHAMTVSTVDREGRPNSRVLILKGLDDGRWLFAASRRSGKGEELAASPWVALNFHWREQGRQVRVRGQAMEASPEEAAGDFLARSEGSRAQALVGNQSQPLADPAELEAALADSRRLLAADGELVPDHWALFAVIPEEVEFWQADSERRHTRLRYSARDGRWLRQRLWP